MFIIFTSHYRKYNYRTPQVSKDLIGGNIWLHLAESLKLKLMLRHVIFSLKRTWRNRSDGRSLILTLVYADASVLSYLTVLNL